MKGLTFFFFKKLFEILNSDEVEDLVQLEPQGQYCRRIWFLYEWLLNIKLNVSDLSRRSYIPLVNSKLQFTTTGIKSHRHLVINNLLGVQDFCPMINKTPKIEKFWNRTHTLCLTLQSGTKQEITILK